MKQVDILRQGLTRGFMGVGLVHLVGVPLSLLVTFLFARTLGPQVYGQLTFVLAILALLVLPVTAGMSKLIVREVADSLQSEDWGLFWGVRSAALRWVLGTSFLVMTAVLAVQFFNLAGENAETWDLLVIVFVLIPIYGMNVIRNATVRGLGRPLLAIFPGQILQPALILVALLVLFFGGFLSLHSALWVYVVVGYLVFLIGLAILKNVRRRVPSNVPPTYRWSYWWKGLVPLSLNDLAAVLSAQLGVLLLGVLSSDAEIAAFRLGERSAYLVGLPLILANSVIAPHIVSLHRANDSGGLQELARKSCRMAFVTALPVALTLVVFGEPIIELVLGLRYVEATYLPMLFLVLGQLVNVFFGSVGLLLDMTGFERLSMYGAFLGIALNGVLSLLLIPEMGAVGAAIGASAGIILTNLILALAVMRHLLIRPMAI